MKLFTVIGARPQFVKASVVSRAFAAWNRHANERSRIREVLVHTGQHYDANMSDVFFEELRIPPPAYHLGIGGSGHGQQTGRMLEALDRVLNDERPDWVLVYGDTNSTLAGGLAACKFNIPVAHVEAGLRSFNRAMPEEINRVLVDHLSTRLFAPTTHAVKNLSAEGIEREVHEVGDVMYDSLLYNFERAAAVAKPLERLDLASKGYLLATVHRAHSTDDPERLKGLLEALGRIAYPILLPLHPRTRAACERANIQRFPSNLRVIQPVSYYEMLLLEQSARVILTDSGGIQKEAFFLHVPCVTLRDETEWRETIESGWNRLAGTDPDRIVAATEAAFQELPNTPGVFYGDGHAGENIVAIMSGERLMVH